MSATLRRARAQYIDGDEDEEDDESRSREPKRLAPLRTTRRFLVGTRPEACWRARRVTRWIVRKRSRRSRRRRSERFSCQVFALASRKIPL